MTLFLHKNTPQKRIFSFVFLTVIHMLFLLAIYDITVEMTF